MSVGHSDSYTPRLQSDLFKTLYFKSKDYYRFENDKL